MGEASDWGCLCLLPRKNDANGPFVRGRDTANRSDRGESGHGADNVNRSKMVESRCGAVVVG